MKNGKNTLVFTIPLVILMIVLLSGCSAADAGNAPSDTTPEEIAEKLCSNVDVPPYETVRLDKENFEFYAFIPYDDSLSAAAADALVNITPHSLVVVRAEDGDGAALAEKILQNADPNKWICVGADKVNVAYTDHYVVLIMSDKETADAIADNFKAMAKELDGMDMKLFTANNSRYDR